MPATAKQRIKEKFNFSVSNGILINDFNLYDVSVDQKLWSMDYYCNKLLNLDIQQFAVFPYTSGTQSYGTTTTPTPMLDISDYCRHLNLLLDGFFMNAMSTLDTLAHQLFCLYVYHPVPSRIYISTARDMLIRSRPHSPTGIYLDDQLRSPWYIEFEPYRHCTTHESLISHDDIIYRFNQVTGHYQLARRIRLPDDPQVRPFTYVRNRAVFDYCPFILRKIQRLVNRVHNCVLQDIRNNGNILPIP